MDENFREKMFATKMVLSVVLRYHNHSIPDFGEEFPNNVNGRFHPSIQIPVFSYLYRNSTQIRKWFTQLIPPDSLNEDHFFALCRILMNVCLASGFDARQFIVFCSNLSECARFAVERGMQNATILAIRTICLTAGTARHTGPLSNSFWAEDIPNAAAEIYADSEMDFVEDNLFAINLMETVMQRHRSRWTPNYYQHVGERYYPMVRLAVLLYLKRNEPHIRDNFTELIPPDSLNEANFTGLCTKLANEWIPSASNATPFIKFCCILSECARIAYESGIQNALHITIKNINLAVSRARNRGVLSKDFWTEDILSASSEICESILGIPDRNNTLFATSLVQNVVRRNHIGSYPNYPGFPERFPDGSSTRFHGTIGRAIHAYLDTNFARIQTRFAEDMLFNTLNEDNFAELCAHLMNELLVCGLEGRHFIEFCCRVSEYSRLAFERKIHRAPQFAISAIFRLMSSRIFPALSDYFWLVDIQN